MKIAGIGNKENYVADAIQISVVFMTLSYLNITKYLRCKLTFDLKMVEQLQFFLTRICIILLHIY